MAASWIFASVGDRLLSYRLTDRALQPRASLVLPARVRAAYAHPHRPILYAACGNADGRRAWYLCALTIGDDGRLTQTEAPVPLPARPIDVTVDWTGQFVLVVYGSGAGLTVHCLAETGRLLDELPRTPLVQSGSVPHQVRMSPDNRTVIVVARGMKGYGGASYVEGSFELFHLGQNSVEHIATQRPGTAAVAGMGGFNPRHLDFSPDGTRFYATLEGQSRVCSFPWAPDRRQLDPLDVADMLEDRAAVRERQDAGTIRVHPSGRYVYAVNRNDGYVGGHKGASWRLEEPLPVFPGGENSVVMFAVAPGDGALSRLCHVPTRGLHARCMAIDASGQMMVAANYAPTIMMRNNTPCFVPAGLVLWRLDQDGVPRFVACEPIDTAGEKIWWMGLVET